MIKAGDLVEWCGSTYFVVDIKDKKALLKQNFSIGTILMERVPLNDISLIK